MIDQTSQETAHPQEPDLLNDDVDVVEKKDLLIRPSKSSKKEPKSQHRQQTKKEG